jgi:hypothetical protein
MQHLLNKSKSRNAVFILIARRAIPSPLNPLNLLNPLNPHARKGVSKGDTTTLGAAGAVKLKNPPAKGRSNFRTLRAQRARPLFFHKYGLCDKIT